MHLDDECTYINVVVAWLLADWFVFSNLINTTTNVFSLYTQGATIKADEETGKIVIARIMIGGAADRSGLIHVGDEVIEVNNVSWN